MRTISIAEVDEVGSRITQASEKECRRLPQRMQKLVASYHQMPLLGAVLEALMTGNEDEPALAQEDTGLALLHLKTVIDCLDQ